MPKLSMTDRAASPMWKQCKSPVSRHYSDLEKAFIDMEQARLKWMQNLVDGKIHPKDEIVICKPYAEGSFLFYKEKMEEWATAFIKEANY